MSCIGVAHERDGLVAPAVVAAAAARLRVSEMAVRGHYREHARHVARKSGLVLGRLERHQIRHSSDFADAARELQALGIAAPAAAIEQAILRIPPCGLPSTGSSSSWARRRTAGSPSSWHRPAPASPPCSRPSATSRPGRPAPRWPPTRICGRSSRSPHPRPRSPTAPSPGMPLPTGSRTSSPRRAASAARSGRRSTTPRGSAANAACG